MRARSELLLWETTVVNCCSPVDYAASRKKLRLLCGDACNVPLGRNLAFRVYADSRPHNLEIAGLQKGLVLTLKGRELIEEGVGFGVPVIVFSDKTYFSGSAQVSTNEKEENKTIVKHFCMDMVSRKRWKGRVFVDNPIYRLFSSSLAGTYRQYPATRRFIFPIIRSRNSFGIRTCFTKTEPRGEVAVTYKTRCDGVDVKVDLSRLNKNNCETVLLHNEQGSTFFRKFLDSDGLSLANGKIGAWDLIDADWACFSDLDNTLSFCLKSLPNCRLFRGREHMRGRLAWAGMGYELSPHVDSFKYPIQIYTEKKKNA